MASVGTHLQLAAKGPQEAVLYGEDPSPFRPGCTKTHTRFAIETKEEVIPDGCLLGKENVMTIPRSGDMLGNIILEFRLPALPDAGPTDAWVDQIGHVLLRRVKFAIDDIELSNSERLWYDISDRLFLKESYRQGMNEMIGKGRTLSLQKSHIVYVPLKLFCCKNHHEIQNFFPLLTMPGSKLYLTLDIERFENCVTGYSGTTTPQSIPCTVLLDYVFLDTAEKERMINRPHTILVETEQDAEALSYKELLSDDGDVRIPLDSVKVDLSEVNYPVKFLAWVVYANNDVQNKRYFTYLGDTRTSTLLLDGVERFSSQEGGYFQLIEKFYKTLRAPGDDQVFLYSFALDASSWQPCGHLTFGEVSKPVLQVDLTDKRPDRVVKVFMVGYKFLDIQRGRVNVRFT